MSTPEEIQSQPVKPGSGASQPIAGPMDVARSIEQLRVLVCGLGAGLLAVSLALSAFAYKQNRNLNGAIGNRQRQIAQLQIAEQSLGNVVNELVRYSDGKPELMVLLAKRGIQVPAAATASQPSSTPQP
jgi:hypothetical protein